MWFATGSPYLLAEGPTGQRPSPIIVSREAWQGCAMAQ